MYLYVIACVFAKSYILLLPPAASSCSTGCYKPPRQWSRRKSPKIRASSGLRRFKCWLFVQHFFASCVKNFELQVFYTDFSAASVHMMPTTTTTTTTMMMMVMMIRVDCFKLNLVSLLNSWRRIEILSMQFMSYSQEMNFGNNGQMDKYCNYLHAYICMYMCIIYKLLL